VDVFGHIEFDDKDQVIAQLKRRLKPDGVMLHAIESATIDYDSMSDASIREFIHVDGHVGMESRSAILQRFERFFAYTDGEVRFIHTRSYDDLAKEASSYGSDQGAVLRAYLMHLGAGERLAFNIAAGIAANSIQQLRVPSDDKGGGMMMLRASDAPLGRANKMHEAVDVMQPFAPGTCVELDSLSLLAGWHDAEKTGDSQNRWSGPRALIHAPVTDSVQGIDIEFWSPETPGPTIVNFSQKSGTGVQVRCDAAAGHYCAKVPREQFDHQSAPYYWIQIETDYVHIPSWWSDSTDQRRLGICAKSIRFW
jgi:hypothetical protein